MSSLSLISLSSLAGMQIQTGLAANESAAPGSSLPWQPPQWPSSQPYTLTLTAADPATGKPTAYVFDAVFRVGHEQRGTLTTNPVQTGSSITDHLYMLPRTVEAEIGMSDSMISFTLGQFSDSGSRSVSAYQTLLNLQRAKTVVQIATRMSAYTQDAGVAGMVISNLRVEESKDTKYGAAIHVTFTEILLATVQQISNVGSSVSPAISAIPQATGMTTAGQIQTIPVSQAVENQNNVNNYGGSLGAVPSVSGSGTFTSSGLGALGLL